MADTVRYRQRNPDTAFETSDWHLGVVGWTFLGCVVFLMAASVILIWAYPAALPDASRRLTLEPPAPRLQVAPTNELDKLRAEEDRKLNTYYWVDRAKGIVHIPIRDAMPRLARDGIAGFPKAQP